MCVCVCLYVFKAPRTQPRSSLRALCVYNQSFTIHTFSEPARGREYTQYLRSFKDTAGPGVARVPPSA